MATHRRISLYHWTNFQEQGHAADAATGVERHWMPPWWLVATLAIVLLAARLLSGHFVWFFQGDEVSLAAAVAALAKGSIGDVYRYGPQAGYYWLVVALDGLAGGDLRAVPIIMIWLSAVAGSVIPLCGLFSFPQILSPRERWVLAGLLAVNPILWMSSTYGNSSMPSVALLVLGATLLSLRPSTRVEILALALFGAAIFVRADAVLGFPLVALLLHQRLRSPMAVVTRLLPLTASLAALYGLLLLNDPRVLQVPLDVAEHLTTQFQTHFWDYLLWSTSPFILAFAAVGLRELLVTRRELFAVVAAWCVPFFGFYYAATTSPRYFLATTVPVSICAAVGAVALVPLLAPRRRAIGWAGAALLSTAHLFVGLGHFTPASARNLLVEAQFSTHAGPMWTGAFLYKSYLDLGLFGRSLRHPGFGRGNSVQHQLDSNLASVESGAARGRTVVALLGGWNGHVFHYYAHLHNVSYVARKAGPLYTAETWMTLSGAQLMSIGRETEEFRAMPRLAVTAGDELWLLSPRPSDDALLRDKLAPGLSLAFIGESRSQVHVFRVVGGAL